MTRGQGNKSNSSEYGNSLVKGPRAERKSASNNQGTPILTLNRGTSYGSCDDNTHEVSAKQQDGRHHPRRHQIGSDLLDFGESALMWLASLCQRLLKKRANKTSSWLDFHELTTGPEVALKCKDNISPLNTANRRCPSVLSITRHTVDCTRTTPLGDEETEPINKRRTIFSLFDLDFSRAVGQDTELEDLTNKLATPRANTVSIPNGRRSLLKQATVDEAYDKPRCLSVSRYLEEISKIGANGASQSTELPEPSPTMTGSFGVRSGCLEDTRASTSQQLDGTAFREVSTATSGTNDNAVVTSQSEAYVTSRQRVEKPSNAETIATVAASSTLCRHNINDKAESNDSAVIHQESLSRAKRATIVTEKQSITATPVGVKPVNAKAVGANSKPKLSEKPQGNKSAPKPKNIKAIVPTSPAKAKAQSTATSPGFAGMLQAAEKGVGRRVHQTLKKKREDVEGGKRPDVAIAMELERQKRKV